LTRTITWQYLLWKYNYISFNLLFSW